MDIYIAASWKQHAAVDLLAECLRCQGHQVFCFTEPLPRDSASHQAPAIPALPDGNWYETPDARRKWQQDMTAIQAADLCIYLGPAGCDAWAEVGAAWACGVPVYALRSKGERVGIQRHLADAWFKDVHALVAAVQARQRALDGGAA